MNMMAPLTAVDPVLTRTEVSSLVALAARTVPPIWPLESAIAVNPLAGFEHLPFEQAVDLGTRRFGARGNLPLAQWRKLLAAGKLDEHTLRDAAIRHLGGVNAAFELVGPDVSQLDLLMARLLTLPTGKEIHSPAVLSADAAFIAKWCAAFFDQGQASNPMPNRELGLYRATLAALAYDAEFHRLVGSGAKQLLMSVPRDPLEAIAEGLTAIGILSGDEGPVLGRLVARLPGWAGHIRWRNENADPEITAGSPAGMADLLALWLLLERGGAVPAPTSRNPVGDVTGQLARHFGLGHEPAERLSPPGYQRFAQIAAMPEDDLGGIFQTAAEWSYSNSLAPCLQSAATRLVSASPQMPDAQLVFCIDVRSEPFRRAIEQQGRYETLGYAGFFGLPIALHRQGDARRTRLLPVLLAPQHDLDETPAPGREQEFSTFAARQAQGRRASTLFEMSKQGAATAFATAEATGPLAGIVMAARTLAPGLVERIAAAFAPSREELLAPGLHRLETGKPVFTSEEKVGLAQALFKLTGLSAQTARLVALVGHGGSAVNNPYAAALDCGACGGHAGGSNARVLAAILNETEVREGLAAKGMAIPESTWFIAAEHNTTTDQVVIFDQCSIPNSHRSDVQSLIASLTKAGEINRQRRSALLDRAEDDLFTGAMHWGEIRPEWGLAGNAAFIVGPRTLTCEIDLEGRAFLHSYDWQSDADGTALTTILTAPMVVAQWINCQYLFSTIDNDRYGSGDKTTQNVVGGIGVLQGNGGDLKVGLPRQSLFTDDGTPFHVPQRLLTVVLAPFDLVERVVESNDILGRLFGNGWVTLVVIDPLSGKALRWRRNDTPTHPQSSHLENLK